MFSGDRPWLGILFWTTFSTSVAFYLFVIASLVARPLAAVCWSFEVLSRPFNLEAHPVRCIAFSMTALTTVGLAVVGGILAALP